MTQKPLFFVLTVIGTAVLPLFLSGPHTLPVHAAAKAIPSQPAVWNRQAAASYLDSREVWWQSWDHAQKDHGTFCVSCHTQATYGLARPVLRGDLGETGPSPRSR